MFSFFHTLSYAGGSSSVVQTPVNTSEVFTDVQATPSVFIAQKNRYDNNNFLSPPQSESLLIKFLWSVIGGLIGAIIALWLEKFQKPKLSIEAGGVANSEHTYPNGYIVPGRWKFFRLKVINNKLPWYLNWFMSRETAESVHALITFKELDKTMKGRWSRTLELAFASQFDKIKLALYPEPETVFVEDSAILDIFAKYEHDQEAYGWNNEAYLNNWRTPSYKLNPGDYIIEVRLVGINTDSKIVLRAHIANSIDDSYLVKK